MWKALEGARRKVLPREFPTPERKKSLQHWRLSEKRRQAAALPKSHSYLVSIVAKKLRDGQEEFGRDAVSKLCSTRRLPFRPISAAPPRRSFQTS